MEFAHIRWPDGRRDQAELICPHCGCAIEDHQRLGMIGKSAWKATAPGDGSTASFRIGGLASPWTNVRELAIEHGQAHRDPARLKTFYNIRLGVPWTEEAAPVPLAETFLDRLEDWGDRLPAGVATITAGVDVQDDRLELEVVGWGRDEECWSLDYQVLWGDPSTRDLWATLDFELARTFAHSRSMHPLPISAACVDVGGHFGASVLRFTTERESRRVFAIKGRGGPGIPIWPKRPSKSRHGRQAVYLTGVDAVKEPLMRRLAILAPGPGYCHFPVGRDVDYFRQLTAERLVRRYVGNRPVAAWTKPTAARNEALDCRVYATSALHCLIAMGLRLNALCDQVDQIPLADPAAASVELPVPPPAAVAKASPVIASPWMAGFGG